MFFLSPQTLFGASFFLSPHNGSFEIGSTLSIGVYANSNGATFNAVSGVLSFPEDLLQVTSISKNQSLVSLWVQEPSFSNSDGIIRFEGIALNPGYSGAQGKVLTINFKVKTAGTGSVTFTSGSILANDGAGTELLTNKGGGTYTFAVEAEQFEITEDQGGDMSAQEELNKRAAPLVSSETHKKDTWSNKKTGIFAFSLPQDATALRLLLDEKENTIPTVIYEPPITSREITDLPEGLSYLHVQYRTKSGWSEVTHYKLSIDTVAPEVLAVVEVQQKKTESQIAIFKIDATDRDSNISLYEVFVGDHLIEKFTNTPSIIFVTPILATGTHSMRVSAFDAAGNNIIKTVPFVILGEPALGQDTKVGSKKESGIYALGMTLITVLSIVVPFVALVLLLVLLLLYGYRKYLQYTNHVAKEVKEARAIAKKAFELLRSDLVEDVKVLEKVNKKRKLTREEAKILKRLRLNIDQAEQAIDKELCDIHTVV